MAKMPKGTFPPRREKRRNDMDAQRCRTRKQASYIHRCLNVRKLQKCGEVRKMENYCLYVNLKEMLKRNYCKGNGSNTKGSCLRVTAPPGGEIIEEGERNAHHRCCKCASHTFDNCYITGLHIFEGIFLTACSGGIVSIFDKNLNNILSRRVATSPISNISVSKKENALCFADSSDHLYVVHLNRRNVCKGNHFHIGKRGSHFDKSAACASTPCRSDDKMLNHFDEDEKHTFLNDQHCARLTKKEKTIVEAFLHNKISNYKVKNLNCCVINPYFDHHQSNSICVLTANKIVSVLNIFEFHINNSVLFTEQHILSLHWHSLYVFICTGASIFVVNFFDKTKIAHVVLANLEMMGKAEVGRLSGEKGDKADVPVNHNGAERNKDGGKVNCAERNKDGDQMNGETNQPQTMCAVESTHICELQKGEYTIARGKNIKIVKIEKINGIEKISISNDFDVQNWIVSISPYYDHHQNGFPENEVCLSVITSIGGTLHHGGDSRTSTHLEHIILTRGNYLMCRNYLYVGGEEKGTVWERHLTNTSCTPYRGGDTNRTFPPDGTTYDREGNSHLIGNPGGGSPMSNLFQYMKITPNWGQRKRSGSIDRCLYIYGKNTLLQFRPKTVAEFFSEMIEKKAKNGRNVFLLLDALKRQPSCRKELTQIGLALINAFIKRRHYFIAAKVFILLCNRFCDKYRVIYNVMQMFFLRKQMHILSLFYRKLKEERTHQGGSGHSSVHLASHNKWRIVTRRAMEGGKKIKSAMYVLHLYYLKSGREKKKTKRDKEERLNNDSKKKKKNLPHVRRVERKKNFLFFATKKLFNQFLVFLLRTDVYEFRKVYAISSDADLNAGMLVKHIALFLEGDLSLRKKQFVRTGGIGGIGGIGGTIGAAKWAGGPHGSDCSSESCGGGGHLGSSRCPSRCLTRSPIRSSTRCASHSSDRSRRSAHGAALKEEKKKSGEKGILLDILLDIFFKFDIPLGAAPFALLCKDREEEKKKKKKKEPHWSSNNGEVTNNDKAATAGEEGKLVKKNLPAVCPQERNKGCTKREKNCRSNRHKEKSACTGGDLHRNERRSEGRLFPNGEKFAALLSTPSPHQRDGHHEGDRRDDEKKNTFLSMEFRRDHADWDGGGSGGRSDGINRGVNRGRSGNGAGEEKTPRGDDPQSAGQQPGEGEKRMKRRSSRGGEGPNRLRHNPSGADAANTVTLSNLTNDYFASAAPRRSAPLTFEDLAEDSSPQNLSLFEKEFDSVKKMEIIKMLIGRKNKKVFMYLKQCSWQVLKKITQRFALKLFRLSKRKTAKLLVIVKVKEKNNYRYFFNPEAVIKRLKERPFFVYTYLKHVKNVKYLSRYIHLFLFLMFIFEPFRLVGFLARHYRCVSFKRVLFFVCFFDRLHLVGGATSEEVTTVQGVAVTNEEVTTVEGVAVTTEDVKPIEGVITTEEVKPIEGVIATEDVTPVEGAATAEEVKPDEEAPPRTRPSKLKSPLFQNERVMLLYRYLLDEQVEKEKLEELFNEVKHPPRVQPRGGNLFLTVKAFLYEKFGYINKALVIYQQLSSYDEMIYLVKLHNLLIDDGVMKKAEDNLASLTGAPFLSGVDRGLRHGRPVGIRSVGDVMKKGGDGGGSSPQMGSNDGALASGGGAERTFRLRRGKKKTSKREEDAHSVFAPNGYEGIEAIGGVGTIDRVGTTDASIHRNAQFANLDREIMLSLHAEGGEERPKEPPTRKGKRKVDRRRVYRSSSGNSPPSASHKEMILKKHLIDNSSREMHYVTLMGILQELFYTNELSENYNKILMRCKANTYSRFKQIKKRGYVIYNGIIKKEMKSNHLYFLDIHDYYFINDQVEDKRSNELHMIMPHMGDEQNELVGRSGADKEEQEPPLHIQREVPSNYYFYEQIHDKPYVSIFSSFCSFCQNNIYLDSCAFEGGGRCRGDSVVFFFCNHLYHLKCLRGRRFVCLECH
ncbi:conserved Plasmodium protein, unknown function [Plasmodium vivax]|uniref:Uncharacterized protein n=1 Tax=Plasmodium vivax TaxID=5855 RepID=A0A564ZSA3_PLAVI|nr:conserved Plasmodium protein, unknown function [Plasmodium vivax]